MFKRTDSMPKRNKFSLTREEIENDIEAIYRNDEQRSKLYHCLDETPPKEHRFEKIEEFLKGTQDLERSSNILTGLKSEIEKLEQEIAAKVTDLRERAGNKQ